MSEPKLQYSTRKFTCWPDAIEGSEEYSSRGWRAVTFIEKDDYVQVVFVKEVQ